MAASGRHNGRYILVGKIPVPCEDVIEWGRWFEQNRGSRILRQVYVGKFEVSTVFLGLDHSFSGDQPPLLFETMIFRSGTRDDAGPMYRDPTWEMALESHERAVDWARKQQLQ